MKYLYAGITIVFLFVGLAALASVAGTCGSARASGWSPDNCPSKRTCCGRGYSECWCC